MYTVAKFGGSSLADARSICNVLRIVRSDPARCCIVVSAPGKRNPGDQKITDLFYLWQKLASADLSYAEVEQRISERYADIVRELGLPLDIYSELQEIGRQIRKGASADYAASRGEYLNGKIMAAALGYQFIDAADCIHFNERGRHQKRDEELKAAISGRHVVIPGFYGAMPDGSIKTFSRGGSDLTGAIVARAMGADIYENWTDVPGLLAADPRIVENPRRIAHATYREIREMAYMGASVFHEEAMFPLQEAGIRTYIGNSSDPKGMGTLISTDGPPGSRGPVIGIAGRRGFTVITVEKALMNQEVGYVRRILAILEGHRISFEHAPSSIDTLSIILDDRQLNGKLESVVREIKNECQADRLETYLDMAMIAVVGNGMISTPGVAAKLFGAVAHEGINIRMINQGSSEISILVGVRGEDYERSTNAIYKAFFAG